MKKMQDKHLATEELSCAFKSTMPFVKNMFFTELEIQDFIRLMQTIKKLPITKLWLSNINIGDNCLIFLPYVPSISFEEEPTGFSKQEFTISDILHLIPEKLTHLNLKLSYFHNITTEDFYNILKTNITDLDLSGQLFPEEEIRLITNLCSIYNEDNEKINNLFLTSDQGNELPIFMLLSGFIGHDAEFSPDEINDLIISYLYQDMYINIIF